MIKEVKKILLALIILCLLTPSPILATLGVGVGTGKIQVNDKLKPGQIYNLPSLIVINTGDEPSNYEVAVTYNQNQTQIRPPNSWFIFSPHTFHLDPGKVQIVQIKLNLPLAVEPGDYFGYLEAHPVRVDRAGVTSINIAAAAKLYFSVVPANFFQAIYYKILSFWQVYSPWPQRFLGLLAVIVIFLIARRFLNIQINLKPKTRHPHHTHDTHHNPTEEKLHQMTTHNQHPEDNG